MNKLIISAALFGSAALLSACSFGSSDAKLGNIGSDDYSPVDPFNPIENPNNPVDPTNPDDPFKPPDDPVNGCAKGKTYIGFGNTELTAGRVDGNIGFDQGRVKPYATFRAEYERMLGITLPTTTTAPISNTTTALYNTGFLMNTSGASFDVAPDRWFVEPYSTAVSMYTAYRLAFNGCLVITTAGAYTTAPSNSTAATECGTWARKYWSRTATQPEIDACVKVAMVDSLNEGTGNNPPTSNPTSATRRWAYTCASVLTAAGFTTY